MRRCADGASGGSGEAAQLLHHAKLTGMLRVVPAVLPAAERGAVSRRGGCAHVRCAAELQLSREIAGLEKLQAYLYIPPVESTTCCKRHFL